MVFAGKGDKTEKYNLWKQRTKIYSQLTGKVGEDLVPYILQGLDDDGLKIYNSLQLTAAERKLPAKIYDKFEERLKINKPNFRAARLDLHFYYQKADESLDDFFTRCKEKTVDCEFTDEEEKERFVEQLLASTPIKDFKKWLLDQKSTAKIEDVLQEGRKHETTLNSLQHIQNHTKEHPSTSISAIKYRRPTTDRPKPTNQGNSSTSAGKCFRCGGDHKRDYSSCPAKESICHHCQVKGHWAKCCLKKSYEPKQSTPRGRGQRRGRGRGRGRGGRATVHNINYDSENGEFDTVDYDCVELQVSDVKNSDSRTEVFAKLRVHLPNKKNQTLKRCLNLKVDTGAQGNTLPLRTFRRMMPENLNTEGLPDERRVDPVKNVTLRAYNGSTIKCYGTTTIECKREDGDWKTCKFYIVDVQGPAICGLQMSQEMGLVTMHCSMEQTVTSTEQTVINSVEDLKRAFKNQFDQIGNLPGKATLRLKDDAVPFIDPPRKYAIHLKARLKEELDSMESLGIITKVTGHSDWCSSLVTSIKKDGSLRVCLDPRKLNEALKRCPHKMSTIEEISHKFHGARYFSKLDAKAGYWSVELDQASQQLTTFRTPFGRWKFQRLPFGLNVSQDIFQQKMDVILENCPGTVGIADDVAVFGETAEEHDKNLMNLMIEAKKNGLVFNSKKCQIKQPEIEYFGMIISANGMKPDQAKVEDLKAMPAPTSKTELQEFLGLITYLGPYIRNLSAKSEPIRKLLCKETPFEWSEDYETVYEHLKTLISNEACLKFYDTEAPTYLMVDASQKGLGAALLQPDKLQDGSYTERTRPVVFASKSLSTAQKNYVNIEREMLAITFGIKRLHTYVFNRPFTVLTDHKPLEVICNKPITAAPVRLQAMMLEIQGYQYKVKYIPGKDIGLADALSRLPNPKNNEDVPVDVRVETVQFSQNMVEEIRKETNLDPSLNELKDVIYNGWPETRNELATPIRDFWSYRDELSVYNGIIHKGERIFIPKPLRARILTNLHTGHLGIVKTQLRAKKDVYWQDINNDIERMCKSCTVCQEHQPAQTHQPLQQTEIPTKPWSTIGTDLFQLGDDQYLIVADYYSKFPLVDKLPTPATAEVVAEITAKHCGIMGIPDIIRSDNGPQYVGQAYKNFVNRWGIQHITSSPRYPRSNGFIERQIQTVKSILKKAKQANEDGQLALLRWRTTPIDAKIQSPAEIMFQRRVKDTLPFKAMNNLPNRDELSQQLNNRQEQQKYYHDSRSRSMPPLYAGQQVVHRDYQTKAWLPAQIEQKAKEPRSYLISTPSGQHLRRNREHLRDVPQANTPVRTPTTPDANAAVNNAPKPVGTPVTPNRYKPNSNNTATTHPVNNTQDPVVKATTPIRTRSGRNVNIPARFRD